MPLVLTYSKSVETYRYVAWLLLIGYTRSTTQAQQTLKTNFTLYFSDNGKKKKTKKKKKNGINKNNTKRNKQI
jgi:hypothetical protein